MLITGQKKMKVLSGYLFWKVNLDYITGVRTAGKGKLRSVFGKIEIKNLAAREIGDLFDGLSVERLAENI